MTQENTWQTWVRYAHNDILVAANEMSRSVNPKARPFEVILYHCQQCAEKMLKAYILYNGDSSWGHDLEALRLKCARYDSSFNAVRLINHCAFLSAFVNARYPDFTASVDATSAERAINSARRIYDHVSERLGCGKAFFP